MSDYYKEDLEKDAPHRSEYSDGILQFIQREALKAETERKNYITPKKLRANIETYRKAFVDMLGFPLNGYVAGAANIKAVKSYVGEDSVAKIYRLVIETIDNIPYYGLLFVPHNYSLESPLAIAFHGGWGTPELASGFFWNSAKYNNMVRRAVERGAVVFAPQNLLWKKEDFGGDYDRIKVDSALKQLGGSITGFELFNARRSLDYLLSEGYGANGKIATIGLSYGGMYAMYLGAADTRIEAVLTSCFFNDRLKYNWTDWAFKNQANLFNDAQTAALIAPRRLYIEVGKNDELFESASAKRQYKTLKEYYKAFGLEENLKFKVFEGVHELDKASDGYDFIFSNIY